MYQADRLLKDSENVDFFIDLLMFYQKDIINYQLSYDGLIFVNQKEDIAKLSRKVTKQKARALLEEMLDLSGKLKYNINLQLAFNKLLISLERGYKYATSSSSDSI